MPPTSRTWVSAPGRWRFPTRPTAWSTCSWKSARDGAGGASGARCGSRRPAAEVETQRTGRAVRYGAAMRLGDGDQQRVELVEERGVRGQVRLEKRPRIFVPAAAWHESVTSEHSTGVGVGDEDRPARRI